MHGGDKGAVTLSKLSSNRANVLLHVFNSSPLAIKLGICVPREGLLPCQNCLPESFRSVTELFPLSLVESHGLDSTLDFASVPRNEIEYFET